MIEFNEGDLVKIKHSIYQFPKRIVKKCKYIEARVGFSCYRYYVDGFVLPFAAFELVQDEYTNEVGVELEKQVEL